MNMDATLSAFEAEEMCCHYIDDSHKSFLFLLDAQGI
jgi:hypothetical protein